MRTLKRITVTVLLCVCVAAAGFSVLRLAQIYSAKSQTDSTYASLTEQVHTQPAEAPEGEPEAEQTETTAYVSPYQSLWERNHQLVGWISIEDTDIDYPVMQNVQDPDYYLDHDFYRRSDYHGVPFVSADCDMADADNFVIYGHHIRDGSMFAQLQRYTDEAYIMAHPYIRFDTLESEGLWRIAAVFSISASETAVFPYHNVTKFSPDTMTAADYLSRAQYYSLWSAEAFVSENPKLITLTTCEYSHQDGRLVIIAEKVE